VSVVGGSIWTVSRTRCTKVRYRDAIAAKLALAKLAHQDKEGHTERRAYFCPACKGHHLTSKPEARRAG
jgi:hypothetical protein